MINDPKPGGPSCLQGLAWTRKKAAAPGFAKAEIPVSSYWPCHCISGILPRP